MIDKLTGLFFDWRWWLIRKKFDSEPVYNKEFSETKIKSHGDEVTDFYDKKFLRWTLIILL